MENYAFQPKELNAGNSALGLELCCREEHFVLLKFLLLRPDRPDTTHNKWDIFQNGNLRLPYLIKTGNMG